MFTTHYYIHAQIARFSSSGTIAAKYLTVKDIYIRKKNLFYSYITKAEVPRPYRQNKES